MKRNTINMKIEPTTLISVDNNDNHYEQYIVHCNMKRPKVVVEKKEKRGGLELASTHRHKRSQIFFFTNQLK